MRKRTTVFAAPLSGLLGIAAVACNGGGSSQPSASGSPVGVYSVQLTAGTEPALPMCVRSLSGTVAYVASPPSLWTCDGHHWNPIPCLTEQAGAVAYASTTDTLWACVERQWTQIVLPQGPQGIPGEGGAPGSQVQVTHEPPGGNCAAGGERIDIGQIVDGGFAIQQTAYVCNGVAAAGDAGPVDAATDASVFLDSGSETSVPEEGGGVARFTAVSVGNGFACALTAGGGVQCWGDNSFGELGNNSTTNSSVPVQVAGLTSGVTAVSAGNGFACAVTAGGGVECWGWDAYGDLGDNGASPVACAGWACSLTPVQVVGLTSGVTAVSAGNEFACAVTGSGGVMCWGNSGSGELGNNSFGNSSVPVQVAGLTSGVTAVSAGFVSACAITAGGGVECWGNISYGDLGNNSDAGSSSVPVQVQVSGLTNGVTAVSAGFYSACAVTAGGGVECWGLNSDGELGDNSDAGSSSVPAQVSGLTSGATAVSASGLGEFACALTVGGGVWCWGYNSFGELGDNSDAGSSSVPVQVSGLTSGVTAVSAGSAFACAVTGSGVVMCWGNNGSGDLGDNSDAGSSSVPVQVVAMAGDAGAVEAAADAATDPISLSPTSLMFEGACGSTPSPQSFTITNVSAAPVTWTATHSGSRFSLNVSGSTLASGAAVTVTMSPSPIPQYPALVGDVGEPVTIQSTTASGATFSDQESATELIDGCIYSNLPTGLNFGDVPVGSSQQMTVQSGQYACTSAGVDWALSSVGTTDPAFQIGPIVHGVGDSWTITFSPGVVGPHTETLTMTRAGAAPTCSQATFSVTGTGT